MTTLFDKSKMRKYLKNLEQKINDKDWTYMVAIADNKTFTRVYSSNNNFNYKEIDQMYQDNPSRFANKQMAYIKLVCVPKKIEDDAVHIGAPWVLAIVINVHRLDDEAKQQDGLKHNWCLVLNLMPEDLEEKPFTLELVKKMILLTRNNKVTSSVAGLNGYQALRDKIQLTKENIKKEKQRKENFKKKKQNK